MFAQQFHTKGKIRRGRSRRIERYNLVVHRNRRVLLECSEMCDAMPHEASRLHIIPCLMLPQSSRRPALVPPASGHRTRAGIETKGQRPARARASGRGSGAGGGLG